MKKTINNNLTSFDDHLDQQYGKEGTVERDQFEEGFEAFKIGVMIQELRKENPPNEALLSAIMSFKK